MRKVREHGRDQDLNSGLSNAQISVLFCHNILYNRSPVKQIFLSYVTTNVLALTGIMRFSRLVNTYNKSLDLSEILFSMSCL